jgi:5-methylcytosine-specific restriction endonuclease McrA
MEKFEDSLWFKCGLRIIETKCRVSWCNNKTTLSDKHRHSIYCSTHIQYKKYAANAPSRPWLMYKVEKVVNNSLICEHCGLDMVKHYKDANLKAIITAMDVDHINPAIKGTPEGEQSSNYQLLCKMCHIIKSYDEGDYKPKKYKNDNK